MILSLEDRGKVSDTFHSLILLSLMCVKPVASWERGSRLNPSQAGRLLRKAAGASNTLTPTTAPEHGGHLLAPVSSHWHYGDPWTFNCWAGFDLQLTDQGEQNSMIGACYVVRHYQAIMARGSIANSYQHINDWPVQIRSTSFTLISSSEYSEPLEIELLLCLASFISLN